MNDVYLRIEGMAMKVTPVQLIRNSPLPDPLKINLTRVPES
jgi:hypothetical protein